MFQKAPAEPVYGANPPVSAMSDDVETVVGPSVNVEGDFSSEGNILVKGIVSGSVRTSKLLTVEPGAKILANVRAGDAVISGEVRGNIKTDNRLELTGSARVAGDIDCKVLVVEAGALMSGKVSMKGVEGEEREKKTMVSRLKPKMTEKDEKEFIA